MYRLLDGGDLVEGSSNTTNYGDDGDDHDNDGDDDDYDDDDAHYTTADANDEYEYDDDALPWSPRVLMSL